jgi:hypothetical protein
VNLETSSTAEHHRSFTLYDYLTGAASAYKKDGIMTSCTGAESSISSKLRGSDKLPTQDNSLRGLILSNKKVSGAVSWLLTEF